MRVFLFITSFCAVVSVTAAEIAIGSEHSEIKQISVSVYRPHFQQAKQAFEALPFKERAEVHLLLIATGHFNAMISPEFGGRLYDAIARFQADEGLPTTGILSPSTLALLREAGGKILGSWGLTGVNHPLADSELMVPMNFGMMRAPTSHGLAFENADHSMSVDYSFYPSGTLTLADIFVNLTAPKAGRRIDYKVIQPSLLAVVGGNEDTSFYSRYITLRDGIVGFTIAWNTSKYPNGIRVAVLMANGLFDHRGVVVAARAGSELPLETSPGPSVTPPQNATDEPPTTQAPLVITGSGFFVSPDGAFVTNNHVVKSCDKVTISGRGPATIAATDGRNDLALLRLSTKPSEPLKPLSFRNAPFQLGEAAYVLGFPYAGALDNGVNFTNGLVSSLSGMDNDATQFQLTAPIQPGNSCGPVIDQSGSLLGVVISRLGPVAEVVGI